jgi:Schlafen, AlbA_2
MRRILRRRVLIFAVSAACVGAALVVAAILTFESVAQFSKLRQTNQQTLQRIRCRDSDQAAAASRCSIRDLKTDWEIDAADFIVVKASRFIIASNPQYRELWLSASDPTFIRRFSVFTTWETPAGEVWRLYSESRAIDGQNVDIMVGERVKADWFLVNCPLTPDTDQRLKEELGRIASRVTWNGTRLESRRINSNVDGYQIVEADTGRVVRWSGEMPAVFPADRALLVDRVGLYREGGDLFLVRADEDEDVLVVAVGAIGNTWWMAGIGLAVWAFVFLLAYVIGVEWLKKYFALRGGEPASVEQALKSGEGQRIEFKHGIVEDALLRAITAFANTNDGTVFIGIDDEARVRGLEATTPKAKDALRHKIFSLIREKIQPCPVVDMDFQEVQEQVVVRLFVPRGEEPLYYLKGVSYVRHGESNITPRPEQVTRILAQYAF